MQPLQKIIKYRQPVVLSNGHFERWHYWGFFAEGQFIGPIPDFSLPNFDFTGLYDKNGDEIYRGDILQMKWKLFDEKENHKEIGFVTMTEGPFSFSLEDCSEPMQDRFNFKFADGLEIIGNTFQNPELLK